MYEELVKALRCCSDDDDNIPCKSCPRYEKCTSDRNMNSLFQEAADAIEELSKPMIISIDHRLSEEEIKMLRKEIANAPIVLIQTEREGK